MTPYPSLSEFPSYGAGLGDTAGHDLNAQMLLIAADARDVMDPAKIHFHLIRTHICGTVNVS